MKIAVGQAEWQSVAAVLDHSLLKPDATAHQVEQLCRQALHYGCAGVCISPVYLKFASELVQYSGVAPCVVIGFPSGAHTTRTKLAEAGEALALGARELDMVIHIGGLISGNSSAVESEIRALAEIAHAHAALLKVILETPLLTDPEIVLGCQLCLAAGADFVKTATGFSGSATVEHIALMRATVGTRCRVKASGGIRTLHDVQRMIAAGADRIGTSSTVAILTELGAPPLAPIWSGIGSCL